MEIRTLFSEHNRDMDFHIHALAHAQPTESTSERLSQLHCLLLSTTLLPPTKRIINKNTIPMSNLRYKPESDEIKSAN